MIPKDGQTLSPQEQIDAAILRAKNSAQIQYEQTRRYTERLNPNKSIHIGETGWTTTLLLITSQMVQKPLMNTSKRSILS